MARLACALAVIAASVANAFDYQVEVGVLNRYGNGNANIDAMVSSEQGLLYALDVDDEIFVIDEASGEEELLSIDNVYGHGLAIDHEGELLFVSNDGCIRAFDRTTDEYTSWKVGECGNPGHVDGEGVSARIGFIEHMVIDAADMHLYILDIDYVIDTDNACPVGTTDNDCGDNRDVCSVRKVHIESGEVETLRESDCAEPGTQEDDTMEETMATFSYGYNVDVHGEHLYITEYGTGAIRRMDIDHPHSVELAYGTYSVDIYDSCQQEGMCGGSGLETRFGAYYGGPNPSSYEMNFAVDDFGEWIFVADGGNYQIYQCTMHPHIEDTECEVIAGDFKDEHVDNDSEYTADAVGTNAAFWYPTAICHGQEHSEDFYVADGYDSYDDPEPAIIRLLTMNDVRSIENESPKFTIGVFVAGGVAALLAGFAILNAAPVA